jgi:pimeloyl-ACP methyl ester carboxylesterase
MEECDCCPPGLLHKIYSKAVRTTGSALPFIERWIAEEYRDVITYPSDAELRERVLERVCTDLTNAQPQIVFAHSLGTVVALDALARLTETLQPRMLVTAGPPLGLPRFSNWEDDTRSWIADKTVDWTNLIDTTDEVTGGDGLDSNQFPTVKNHSVNNDKYSTYAGPDGGWGATHSIRHNARHRCLSTGIQQLVKQHMSEPRSAR